MSTGSVIAYGNLQVSPYQLVNLQELTLTKEINEHGSLRFTGIIPEEMQHSYVEMTDADTTVEVSQIHENGGSSLLFSGLVLGIEVKVVRGVHYLEVEAVSHSYKLDVKRKSRSFQNTGMIYGDLLNKVAIDYPDIDILDDATGGKAIGTFTMQYFETDWAFLKRMASRFHTGLVPATTFDKPKLFFGLPEGGVKGNLHNFHYTVKKKMAAYRDASQNHNPALEENDFIFYEVETKDHVLNIGDVVQFKGRMLIVNRAYTEMKDGLLKHEYTLCTRKGLSRPKLYNEPVTGVSIQGKIIEVIQDTVKVHLEIDKEQNVGEAYRFPYSSVYTAEGNSGWYVMPEKGDTVRVYIPSNKEEDAIALSSVRQDKAEGSSNKLGNPDHKFFRTASGKELMMTPSEVVITAKDNDIYIRLSDADGIQISSSQKIQIVAKEDIMMESQKKVMISAMEELTLTCKESSMKLDGNTEIIGQELKTN